MRKHLPQNYHHPNSQKSKEPAYTIIEKPEPLQETVNKEFVEYLEKAQWKFLIDEVAEGAQNKDHFMKDLKLITDHEITDEMREAAENRIKGEVKRHGVWIGHGNLLTMKMFYVAKSLRFVV